MLRVYKTFEIDDDLWQKITDGFNESFERNVAIESIRNGYCTANKLGYGYHAVDTDDETGEVRGFYTCSPSFYKHGLKIVLGGSTYVRKKYRKDVFITYDMEMALRETAKADGFDLLIGISNYNSIEYARKILKAKDVGSLSYYLLPRNLSRTLHKKGIRFADGLLRLLADSYILLHSILASICNHKEEEVDYSLELDDDFYNARFHGEKYKKYSKGDFFAYFTISNEDGARVAYLMDFRENGVRTKKALVKSVQYLARFENPDAILYVGMLNLRQHLLFKLPFSKEPKHFPLTYRILDKGNSTRFESINNPKNWDFSLMNFDVR
jgi:hypothetical protein